MSTTVNIEVGAPWAGAGEDWPDASTPVKGCWQLGLPSAAFTVERPVSARPVGYVRGEDASTSPLLARLLDLEGVEAVLAKGTKVFVSCRAKDAAWTERVAEVLREHLTVDEDALRTRIQEVLDRDINPGVAMHGGYIQLLDVKGTTAFIKMGGGCQGCGMASVTLKQGVERSLKEHVPEIEQILDTTDHASGNNPYYAPQSK